MRYYDYEWDLEPNRILLDKELDIDKLGWRHGDYFKITNVNGRAMLVKVDALEKFIKEGEHGQMETRQLA
jgi:anaerobic selenocysteine-containing dehydrogenase